MAKYDPLRKWLESLQVSSVTVTFARIEKEIIHASLPSSVSDYRPWWANQAEHGARQCRAWLTAAWRVDSVDLTRKVVAFRKL